ncbi:MAG TPA: UvrD-helicase domain-containing protein [Dysgonamonadaceae bacterium]|nr:UvrD-helicase domain-containing protein [Dysgonamonadaceae bacterium]
MSSNNPPYLHVYKASAGSGKTHQLTGEYIRLLFEAPHNYRHILAVTFTNKATDEMKSRIVKELNNLAVGNKSEYLQQLMEEFKLSEQAIRQQSNRILQNILHNYSTFSISTIDRFFQQTMRAFTREMGIAGGYKVEVDNASFLPEIVDLMLNELDEDGNEELIKWLLDFMGDRIRDNKTWKINDEIIKLSYNLFDERFITLSAPVQDQIKDKEALNQYKQTLWGIIREFENRLKEVGKRAQNIVDLFDLIFSDFKGGSRSQFLRFEMWAKGEFPDMTATFLKFPDDVEFWYSQKTPDNIKHDIEAAYSSGLNDCVKQIIHLYDNAVAYITAKEILRLFNTLGILNDVNERLQTYRKDSNMLFLSDATELLNKIIADSESPFVYEKIGSRLNHFMIDEFQDTSIMQWNNFRPLLQESLAGGNYNLIVGDVKQSIYRWRNSDWRLLEEQIEEDFLLPNIHQHTLGTNWRSDENIIHFNNQFFKQAARIMQDEFIGSDEEIKDSAYFSTKIVDAYSEVFQQVAPHNQTGKGSVSINFIDQEEVDSWEEEAMERLPKTLEQLQDDNFRLKDIAILVRTGKEAVMVSETLLRYKDEHPDSKYSYDFISNEALLLNNASSIKTVVSLLNYMNNPLEKTMRVRAIYEYYRFTTDLSASDIFDRYVKEQSADIPEELSNKLSPIATLPLYELAEALFDLLKEVAKPTDTAYIQAFLDLINEYSISKTADLSGFLSWWNEQKNKKSLFSPEDQDAIQLMTIHKSKGLEFGVVIVPFANWTFDPQPNRNILWCKPEVEPFSDISVVPVMYSSKLSTTIFKQDFLQEKLYSYIDNLNLLYVAFTRPEHRLIISAPMPKENKRNKPGEIKRVSDLLCKSVTENLFEEESQKKKLKLIEHYEEEMLSFNFGKADRIDDSEKMTSVKETDDRSWESTPFRNRLKMRLLSIGYFSDDGTRDFGKLMHEIVSEINSLEDLDIALEKRVLSGELTTHEKGELYQLLTDSLSLPQVKDWYSGNYHVLNEQQVLHPSLSFIRPDRVMIGDDKVIVVDYKFGESIENKYVKQVQRYVNSIKSMGYDNVQGFVFYVKLQNVVKV